MIAFMKRYSGFFLLIVGIIGLMIMNIVEVTATPSTLTTNQTTLANENEIDAMTDSYYFVDIKGEVIYPAVYQVKSGTRVEEVIQMAGGLTSKSDLSEVNLAKMIYDQMVIYIPTSPTLQSGEAISKNVFIDIKGAVRFPGVYQVPSNFRVYDAIMRAGGFAVDADSSLMNLSELVDDQMVILIPKKTMPIAEDDLKSYIYVEVTGEVVKPGLYHVDSTLLIKDIINLAGGIKSTADLTSIDLNQGIVNQQRIHIPAKTNTPINVINPIAEDPNANKININEAMVDELDTLPGIGYIIAQRIIDYRAEYGNFDSIEDIMNVSGIKEVIYAQIKDLICV